MRLTSDGGNRASIRWGQPDSRRRADAVCGSLWSRAPGPRGLRLKLSRTHQTTVGFVNKEMHMHIIKL